MRPHLQPVVMALAELDEGELAALIEASNSVPQTAPGLLAWIESACDWELHRRRGFDYPLLLPEAAIPPEEDSISIDAAMVMRLRFAQDDRAEARGVVLLFDAVVGLLSGDTQCH